MAKLAARVAAEAMEGRTWKHIARRALAGVPIVALMTKATSGVSIVMRWVTTLLSAGP